MKISDLEAYIPFGVDSAEEFEQIIQRRKAVLEGLCLAK